MVQDVLEGLLAQADVQVNGDRPWDLQVHDKGVYRRILAEGSVGLGETYMDGWWSCEAVDQLIAKLVLARLNKTVVPLSAKWTVLRSRLFNLQTRLGSRRVIDRHYEISPAVFMSFLDPYNQYTCGYFKDTRDLNVAQEQTRSDLPQVAPDRKRPSPGYRLRLGRIRQVCRRTIWLSCHRDYDLGSAARVWQDLL